MLSESQISLMDELTDEFVDSQIVVDESQVDLIMAQIDSTPDIYEKWNVWNSSSGSSSPVLSGSAQSPPSCQQDGNSPCASCDCC